MAAPAAAYKDRQFLAVIGDEVRQPEGQVGAHADRHRIP
jgi:hypothetical protein